MSATEDDTELRDLLIQNLENNGVLNKLKAEMRAAVFLAMEEQDKLENKSPLINESLKKCLNTKEGRLVAALIVDFLQVFNLDFTLAVFQPEINSLGGLETREEICRDLDLSQSDGNRKSPLLLELVKRGRVKQDCDVISSGPVSKIPRYRAPPRGRAAAQDVDVSLSKGEPQQPASGPVEVATLKRRKEEKEEEEQEHMEEDEGDSFFDDPLPKPQKTYGCLKDSHALPLPGPVLSPMRRGKSLSDLSLIAADSDDGGVLLSELRKVETPGTRSSPAGSLSEAPGGGAGGGAGRGAGGGAGGGSSVSEQSHSRSGARESKVLNDKTGSLHLDDEVEYDDDFNSHRSDLSKSELSIGEEIEEVSIEGPDQSDKLDDSTQDLSVSQLSHSQAADYMEEVA